jgi:hypothetical protein
VKIDWKHLSTTKGYKSLKAACAHDIRENLRDKKASLKKFNWVICRAKSYAHNEKVSIDVILDRWEENRSYWWLNYYQDCNQPKIATKKVLKSRGIKGQIKDAKHGFWSKHDTEQGIKNHVCRIIRSFQMAASNKTKPRWTKRRKERGY